MRKILGYCAVAMLSGGLGWLMADGAKSRESGAAPRFPPLTMEQLTEAQKPLGEQIMKVSSVGLGGPYNPMLRSPVLGQRMFDLLRYLRWETSPAAAAERIRHPHHGPAVALAGGVVRPCAASHQGRTLARDRRRVEGQPAPVRDAGG